MSFATLEVPKTGKIQTSIVLPKTGRRRNLMVEANAITQEFENVFGFESCEDTEVRRAQQLIINAALRHLGGVVTADQRTLEDLSRELTKGFSTSGAVQSFANGLQRFEGQLRDSQAAYERAVDLARGEGFSASGKFQHEEAKRVFGLESINDPLSPAEKERISAILEALAAAFVVAEDDVRKAADNRSSRPTQDDISKEDELENSLKQWKSRFWEAHTLARSLGCTVMDTRNQHLPGEYAFTTIFDHDTADHAGRRKNFVARAIKEDLI